MSAETSAWAKEQHCGDRTVKAVLREIANWANPAGTVQFLSIKRIAEVVEVDPRTVKRCINKLEQPTLEHPDRLGLIRRVPRFRDDGGQSASGFELVGYELPMTVTPGDRMSRGGDTVSPLGVGGVTGGVTPVSPLKRDKHNIPPSSSDEEETPTADFEAVSEDWTPPTLAELSEASRRLVAQWPSGAYEASCEAFRLHEINDSRPRRKPDWRPRLYRWLITDHAKIIRAAKAGVSYEALAPSRSGSGAPCLAAPPRKPVAAQRHEDERSAELRKKLFARLGTIAETWFRDAALLVTDSDELTIVTSTDFARGWIEQNLRKSLIDALGDAVTSITITVERSRSAANAKEGS